MSGKLSRREFLKGSVAVAVTAGALAAIPGVTAATLVPERKPNVIYIFADQLRSQALGCYGDKQARTPNLDRLAAEGARFNNAISTWPVCSPYRGMLITGRYPMSNGVIENNRPLWDGQETVATVLKAQGYATGYIGKWHLNGGEGKNPTGDRRFGFDYWVGPNEYPMFKGQQWRPEKQTDDAIGYIKAHKDKPFCLFMSWNPPHDPYIAPDRFMSMFPKTQMELRPNVAEKELVKEQLAKHPLPSGSTEAKKRARWRERLDSDTGVREILSGYYAATAGLDACMGRIMDAIKEAGIENDTILVFSSDHGDMLGSHRMCLKQEPFEESISVPFIVRYPRHVPASTQTDALISPVDVMPTLLALAGVPCPESVEGISVAEATRGMGSDQQDAVLIMKMMPGGNPWAVNAATEWRGVRTKTHTYARLADGGPWVLFDNRADPGQMKNLIDDPAHKKLQDDMEATMQRLLKKAHDPFDTRKITQQIDEQTKTKLRAAPKSRKVKDTD